MDNQHRQIKGYRELTPIEIALMNRVKEKGKELEQLIGEVKAHVEALNEGPMDADEEARLARAQPFRWIDTAQTDLQQGLMALTRAVAQPTFF